MKARKDPEQSYLSVPDLFLSHSFFISDGFLAEPFFTALF